MKVLVSACLLGKNVKYNGGNNLNKNVIEFLKDKEIVEICPEMLAELGCPRECVELINGVAITKSGRNVDKQFRSGVQKAINKIKNQNIDLAVLQSRSPTCGAKKIYDGSFTGRLIDGQGMLVGALTQNGIKVVDAEDIIEYQNK